MDGAFQKVFIIVGPLVSISFGYFMGVVSLIGENKHVVEQVLKLQDSNNDLQELLKQQGN